jgi:GDPmannose 4,6-dehydratase
MKKRALITGVNGMDGSHLAEFLLEKNYDVYGLERRTSTLNRSNTAHLVDKIKFIQGDLTDKNSLIKALEVSDPHEVYNLAAQSFVGASWNLAEYTTKVNALGVLNLLESIREHNKEIRVYQASTSEMFGGEPDKVPQNEYTPFHPKSPYAVAKLYAHWISKNFRQSYGMFICCGILFNHESERRGIDFVTRKITDGVARIHLGLQDKISLGNLDPKRDWGYAPDYVKSMWMMLQQDKDFFFNNKVGDFVIATGKAHSVKDFLRNSFDCVGIDNWEDYVVQDPRYMRPAEVHCLQGDPTKAKEVLGWEPTITFEEMISRMVENDINLLKRG